MILLCHSFNNIFENPGNASQIFADYLAEKKIKVD
jgi:hypothetical protein